MNHVIVSSNPWRAEVAELPGVRVFRFATALGLTAAALTLWAGPAQAATCPTVDPSTGVVTPGPSAGVQWAGCDLSGANMSGGNLGGADLTSANLTGATLTGTDLMSADLTSANLTNADLAQAMLSGTTMTGATLTGVSSGLISGTPSSLPSGWILASNYLIGPGANLQHAHLGADDLTDVDLSNANLTDAVLANVTLTGASLTGATLTGVSSSGIVGTPASLPANWVVRAGYLIGPAASLTSASLGNLDLSGLTLTGIDLNTVDLSGTNLSNTNLADAIVIDAKLTGANLTGASLTGEQSSGITGTPASLPAGWSIAGGFLIGPGADLHGASLAALNLSGADLSGADLSSADLTTTNLTGANLTSASLTSATAGNANLTSANLGKANLASGIFGGANLTDAKLSAASLTDADLADSNLAGTTLTGATLTGASGVGIKGTPAALPANWSVRRGYLIGPGAGTLLTDANLSNIDLTGVDFSGLNLLRATFQHANLTRANLTGANLTGVNFSGANLTRANLDGATVSSTNFSGTVWSSTTCPDGSDSSTHAHGWCFPPPPSSGFTAHRLQVPPGALANSFSPLTISCSSATLCFGGGSYVDPARGYLPALLRWNGTQWSVSGTALPAGAMTSRSFISAVAGMSCPSSTRCFAGGSYRTGSGDNQGMLLRWSAGRWGVAKAPLPANAGANPFATVAGMSCPSVTMCFAVGQYSDTTGGQDGLILRWSGTTWSPSAAPVPAGSAPVASLNAVSCPSLTLCFAGGWQYDASSQSQLLMLRWSAGKWAVVKVPLPAGAAASPQAEIAGVSCPSVTQCVAAGSYVDASGHQQGLLLTRSGSTWTAAKSPLPAGAGGNPWASLFGVSCPTTSHCTAAGGYQNTASQSVGLLLFWSGNSWKAAPAPASAYLLHGISCPTLTRCVAVSNGIALTGP